MSCDVLVPVYNTPGDALARALESVVVMSGVDHILIYDDASTAEATLRTLDEFKARYGGPGGRLQIFSGKVNQGPGYGRNFLMRRSQAEFVLFHDADDISQPERVEVMVEAMETKDEVPVFMTSDFKTSRKGPRSTPLWGDYSVTRRSLEHTFPIRFAGAMVRREDIIDAGIWFPQGVTLNEDVIFLQRVIVTYPFRVNFLNKVLWEATAPKGNLADQAHPRFHRNVWTRPDHFYIHHAIAADLKTVVDSPQGFDPGKWGDRLKTELVSAYNRFILGYEDIANALNGAPPDAFIDPSQTTTRAGQTSKAVRPVPTDVAAKNTPGTRPGDGAVIYFGHDLKEHHDWIRPWAEKHGRAYEFIKIDADFYRKAAPRLKRASYVVIWNGCQTNARNATALCDSMKIPTCFFEWGVQPQKDTFLVDLKGMVNRSMLMDALDWVTDTDIKAFEEAMEPIREKYPLRPKKGRILVSMQIENDTQVIYSGAWRNMAEVVEYVEHIYPNHEIVVRPHPKSGNQFNFKPTRGGEVVVEAKDKVADFLDAARLSDVVVGLNSTSLIEAAMLGVNTIALADCPLRAQPLRHRTRLLAGYWALRSRRNSCISDVLDRFGVHPID